MVKNRTIPFLDFSFLTIAVCFFSLILLLRDVSAVAQNNLLDLATGNETGVYYPVGLGIAQATKKADIEIKVVTSKGSLENLTWLEQGKAQLCFAQSDIVYYAFNGLDGFSERLSHIRVISSLYTEAVHILIRNPLFIKKIEDMRGKRISVGPVGSGTQSNALAILEASGLTQNEVKLLNLDFDDAIEAVKENRVDVVFVTSGFPSDVVNKMLQHNAAYLFELKSDVLRHLIEITPFFVITKISLGTYPNQREEITTIGVSALLVGRSDLNDNLVYNLTKSIFTNSEIVMQYYRKGGTIKLESALKGAAIPIFKGADDFYRENGLYRAESYKRVLNPLLAILVAIFLITVIVKVNKPFIRVLAGILLVWFLGSFMLYSAEHKINENYPNILISLWSGLVNLINFGSKEPFTTTGRAISIGVTILGLGGVLWLTADITSTFVKNKIIKRTKMCKKNHYVIANWNDKGPGIIEALRSSDLEEKHGITIISESTKLASLIEKYESVLHIHGSPLDQILLEKANIENAKSIIILAKEKSSNIADAETIMLILRIRKCCKNVPIVADIIDPKKVDLATFAGDQDSGSVEIISSQNLGQKLLAQAAINPGLSKVYEDLLTFHNIDKEQEEDQEIYRCDIPTKFRNRSFNELLQYASELRNKGINIIPIAISKKDKIMVNPTKNNINLRDSDYIFAIASNEKHLKKFCEFCEKV
jgi:TRAP transporter TAXI family solute receptor